MNNKMSNTCPEEVLRRGFKCVLDMNISYSDVKNEQAKNDCQLEIAIPFYMNPGHDPVLSASIHHGETDQGVEATFTLLNERRVYLLRTGRQDGAGHYHCAVYIKDEGWMLYGGAKSEANGIVIDPEGKITAFGHDRLVVGNWKANNYGFSFWEMNETRLMNAANYIAEMRQAISGEVDACGVQYLESQSANCDNCQKIQEKSENYWLKSLNNVTVPLNPKEEGDIYFYRLLKIKLEPIEPIYAKCKELVKSHNNNSSDKEPSFLYNDVLTTWLGHAVYANHLALAKVIMHEKSPADPYNKVSGGYSAVDIFYELAASIPAPYSKSNLLALHSLLIKGSDHHAISTKSAENIKREFEEACSWHNLAMIKNVLSGQTQIGPFDDLVDNPKKQALDLILETALDEKMNWDTLSSSGVLLEVMQAMLKVDRERAIRVFQEKLGNLKLDGKWINSDETMKNFLAGNVISLNFAEPKPHVWQHNDEILEITREYLSDLPPDWQYRWQCHLDRVIWNDTIKDDRLAFALSAFMRVPEGTQPIARLPEFLLAISAERPSVRQQLMQFYETKYSEFYKNHLEEHRAIKASQSMWNNDQSLFSVASQPLATSSSEEYKTQLKSALTFDPKIIQNAIKTIIDDVNNSIANDVKNNLVFDSTSNSLALKNNADDWLTAYTNKSVVHKNLVQTDQVDMEIKVKFILASLRLIPTPNQKEFNTLPDQLSFDPDNKTPLQLAVKKQYLEIKREFDETLKKSVSANNDAPDITLTLR